MSVSARLRSKPAPKPQPEPRFGDATLRERAEQVASWKIANARRRAQQLARYMYGEDDDE